MEYFRLRLEIPASIGENSEMEIFQGSPVIVKKVHLVFDGWLGDDLMKTSPVFYVTEKLKEGLESSSFSGFLGFEKIETTKSENFEELYPGEELPHVFLFRVGRNPRLEDFGIELGKLIVSQLALDFLTDYSISEVKIEELD